MTDRFRLAWLNWVPVIAWGSLIFFGSTDTFSSSNTSRFIDPLLRWFHPELTNETLAIFQFIFRKGWHVTEFAIFTLLLWNALGWRGQHVTSPNGWDRKRALLTAIGGIAYAISDEFHQSFQPSRQGQISDVLIDIVGVLLAIVFLRCIIFWQQRPKSSNAPVPRHGCS